MADEVVVKITGDASGAEKALKLVDDTAKKTGKSVEESLSKPVQTFNEELNSLSKSLNSVGLIAGGVFASISAFAYKSIQAFQEQDAAVKGLEQALKNTNSAVGLTSKQIQKLASDIQDYSNFGDEAVLSSSKLLAVTKNLTADGFIRAQKAVVDLSAALGKDLTSVTLAVGKAMEDPIEGLNALTRSGVRFTEEQEKVVKSLVQTGQVLEAQNFILDAVEKKYKGFAASAANPFIQLKNDVGDVMEEFGKIFLEELEPLITWIRDFAKEIKNNQAAIRVFADGLILVGKAAGLIVAAVGAVKVVNGIAKGIDAVSKAATLGSASMKTFIGSTGVGLLLIILPDVIDLLKDFWEWIAGPKIDTSTLQTTIRSFADAKDRVEELNAEIARRRSLGIETDTLEPALKIAQDEVKGLGDAITRYRNERNADREASRKGAQEQTETEASEFHKRVQLIRDENAELKRQADAKVFLSKDVKNVIAGLDKEAAFAKTLLQSEERDKFIKDINDQKNALIDANAEKFKIEQKFLEDKAKLDAERKAVEETPTAAGGVEQALLLEGIAFKQQALEDAHQLELQRNVEKNAELVAQSQEFLLQRQELDIAQKELDDEIRAAEIALEIELQRQLDADELAALAAHLKAKQDLEKGARDNYTKDVITYGKFVADLRKTFQSQEMKDTATTFDNLNTLTKGGLKELGLINKAFKIKDVIVDTAAAISKANAVGFPANIPAIAAAATTGAVQLATIVGTGYASGGIVTGGIPNIDSVPIMAQAGELIAPKRNFDEVVNAVADRRNGQANGGDTSNSVSVVIQGNVMADNDEQVDRLIERINDAIEFRNTKFIGAT